MNTDLKLMIYQKCFVSSVVALTELLHTKAITLLNNSKINDKSLQKLIDTCVILSKEYKGENDGVSEFNQGGVIKKVYKTLKPNVKLLKEKDTSLFSKRTHDTNAIITIIPGLNIGLLVEYFDETEKKHLWEYIYLLFCYAAHLVAMTNNENKNEELWNIINELEKEVCDSDVVKRLKFNPYVGVQTEANIELNVNDLLTNSDKIVLPNNNTGAGLMDMLGVDKMLNKEQLMEQLKNIDDKQIGEVTQTITELLGASGDRDVAEVTSSLVKDIVQELKTGGIGNMMDIASRVSEKMSGNMDPSKVKKTAIKMQNMMSNSESKLKNMKDSSGNPIGEELFNKLAVPLQMAQSMGLNFNNKPSKKKSGKK